MTPPDLDRLAAWVDDIAGLGLHTDEPDCVVCQAKVRLKALLAHVRAVEGELNEAMAAIRAWSQEDFTLVSALKYLIACDSSLSAHIKEERRLHERIATLTSDLDIAQGSHEHDCGIFQERWCTCRVANAPVDAAVLDRLVEAREWMDTIIHGGAKFAKGSTLVDGEHLLERIDATLMQEPAPVDAAAVEREKCADEAEAFAAKYPKVIWPEDARPGMTREQAIEWAGAKMARRTAHNIAAALRATRATRTADGG